MGGDHLGFTSIVNNIILLSQDGIVQKDEHSESGRKPMVKPKQNKIALVKDLVHKLSKPRQVILLDPSPAPPQLPTQVQWFTSKANSLDVKMMFDARRRWFQYSWNLILSAAKPGILFDWWRTANVGCRCLLRGRKGQEADRCSGQVGLRLISIYAQPPGTCCVMPWCFVSRLLCF